MDWIAIYESKTSTCFYIPACVWDGHTQLALRMKPTLNGQSKRIRWASDFMTLEGHPQGGSSSEPALPFDALPE